MCSQIPFAHLSNKNPSTSEVQRFIKKGNKIGKESILLIIESVAVACAFFLSQTEIWPGLWEM